MLTLGSPLLGIGGFSGTAQHMMCISVEGSRIGGSHPIFGHVEVPFCLQNTSLDFSQGVSDQGWKRFQEVI